MTDIPVSQLATTLLNCLCNAAAEETHPPLNCCLRAGTEVVADADLMTDLCCEGLAYVLIGDQWPSDVAPQLDINRQASASCGIVSWMVELRFGIMRCAPTGTTETMPTCEDWTLAAANTIEDARALRRTVCCYIPAIQALPLFDGMSMVVGRQVQGPIQGGCMDRYMTVQIQLPNLDCCTPLPSSQPSD